MEKYGRVNCFQSGDVRVNPFFFGEDDADAILAEALVEGAESLLFPSVVLPEPFSRVFFDAFLHEGEDLIHHAGNGRFYGLGEIGPDGIGIMNGVFSFRSVRGGKNNGAFGFVGEKRGRSRCPGSSSKKGECIAAIGHALIAHNADEGAFFQSAEALSDGVVRGDDAPSVFFSNGDDPAIEAFIFNRLANGDALHARGAV